MDARVLPWFFMVVTAPAFAEPWGWAEGPLGRTPLTGATVPADATNVVFSAGTVTPGPLTLSNRKLIFTAASEGTTVVVAGARSGFDLSGVSGDWTFRGIGFRGTGERSDLVYDGGAICCRGGRLALESCTFANLNSRFTGGAVSAYLMDGDVTVSNCTFTGNASGPMNGMGGALYASRSATGTGTLWLDVSSFFGNAAQNGGAVSTVRVADDDEKPMPVEVGGCTFRGNSADYSGGAIDDEGGLSVTNTLFADNGAAFQGGAICAGTSDPDWAGADLTVCAGTEFRGNSATNAVSDGRYWTAGGAISLAGEGYSLSVDGRHVVFAGNRAVSPAGAYGGAISAAGGTSAFISLAQLGANQAETGGGAVFSWGKGVVVNVSVFSNNTVRSETGYGGAVAVESAKLVMSNVTVRGSNATAVDAYGADLVMANDLVAGNGETDICAMADETGDVVFSADHCAYGVATVGDDRMTVVTNGCLSGVDESVYLGESLCLDPASAFTSVIEDGLPQDNRDYDGVRYGSKQNGTSIGAFECGNVDVEPKYVLENVVWYHCRSTGLYYPGFDIRFDGGNADRLRGVTLTCDGQVYELTADDVARLRKLKDGGAVHMGVSPQTFVQYSASPENWGFVPPGDRLFGVADSKRTIGFSVELVLKTQVAQINRVASVRRADVVRSRSASVPVAARFADFRAGERISGRVESVTGARIWLFGCVALGSDWQEVGEIETDGEGRFAAVVPEGLRFFRLEAEVAR